jgi:hypothetical protein
MWKFLGYCVLCICIGAVGLFYMSKEPSGPRSQKAFDRSIGLFSLGRDFVLEETLDQYTYATACALIGKKSSVAPIPFTIHQIWIEETPIPDDLARGASSVKLYNSDCSYTLWTKEQYEPLVEEVFGIKDVPKSLQRDIAASAILYRHGGIVVDLEEECVQSFAPILSLGDCVVGFEPPRKKALFGRKLFLSSAVIAATPAHPLVLAWGEEMCKRSTDVSHRQCSIWVTQESLTAIMTSRASEEGHVLFLGPTYFCPISPQNTKDFLKLLDGEIHRNWLHKVARTLHIVSPEAYSTIANETIAFHTKGGRQA